MSQTDLRLTAICSPGLLFNGRHPCNPYNYMDDYSNYRPWRDGRQSWPSWSTHRWHM